MNKLLDNRLIFIDAEVSSSSEAIHLMADKLEELGYVEPGYGDAVCERERIFPTGLPGKTMGIAIPHTNNLLVNRPAIGVIIPKAPVVFDMMGEPGTHISAKLIIPLVIKDSDSQIDLLKEMMRVIQNGELLERIRGSRDKDEIIESLRCLEKA